MKELEMSDDNKTTFFLEIGKDEILITLLGQAECEHATAMSYQMHDTQAMKLYEFLKKYFGDKEAETKKQKTLEKIEKHLEKLAKCVEYSPNRNAWVFHVFDYN